MLRAAAMVRLQFTFGHILHNAFVVFRLIGQISENTGLGALEFHFFVVFIALAGVTAFAALDFVHYAHQEIGIECTVFVAFLFVNDKLWPQQ